MMSDALTDIARLKAIAQEGRNLPLLGGRHLILWGCAVSLATLLHWIVVLRVADLPMIAIPLIWAVTMIGAAIIARTRLTRGRANGRGSDIGNRVERAVWQFGGAFLGLIATSILVFAWSRYAASNDPQGFALFGLMPPITFGIYAVAMRTTAEVASLSFLKIYAFVSLGFVVATVLSGQTILQFPITVVGILWVSVIPGRMMLALERAAYHG